MLASLCHSSRCILLSVVAAAAVGCSGGDDVGASDAVEGADAREAVTWSSAAAGFFETYCHECHGPGDVLRDYSQLEAVRREAGVIRCGVAPEAVSGCEASGPDPGQFPVGSGPRPSEAERWHLVSWIEAGTPE